MTDNECSKCGDKIHGYLVHIKDCWFCLEDCNGNGTEEQEEGWICRTCFQKEFVNH